jgi:MSHA pilin protein MshC
VRRPSGFTIVEIVVVLLLMSILAATVIGRSITSSDLDLNSATDKIRNQIRYAQSQAMKRTDSVWGIQSDISAGIKEYWMFRADSNGTEEVRIPGGDYGATGTRISFDNLGADLNSFTIVFDWLGRPYNGQTGGVANNPIVAADNPKVTVTKGETRLINITPETGLIR